jgi:flagellar hook-associated protein 3 FlgL
MKQQANTAAQELTTGYSANIGRKLGGDLTRFAGIEASLSRLTGYKVATDFAATTTTAMQTVFGQIDALTAGVGTSLLNAANAETPRALDGLVADASQRFDAVLASLNTKVGDRTLFAGTAADGAAVASSNTILSALETAVTGAGAVTSAEIESAVVAWFDDPGGFETIGYLGNQDTASVSISEEDKVSLGFTAATPAIRNTLKSLAMIALAGRNTVIPDADTGTQVVRLAATALLQNDTDRANLAGDLGFAQARIDQAQTRNEAEASALQLARSDLVAVDPYEAATRLEAAQTQLETLYSVTSRLSRLRLVDFLR